jgi:hypothetical protein
MSAASTGRRGRRRRFPVSVLGMSEGRAALTRR